MKGRRSRSIMAMEQERLSDKVGVVAEIKIVDFRFQMGKDIDNGKYMSTAAIGTNKYLAIRIEF